MKYLSIFFLMLPLFSCGKTPSILWITTTEGPVYGSPAFADGLVFIGSQDKYLYALKSGDGSVAWKQNLGSKVVSTPVLRNGSLYIGSGNGEFYSLNPKTGKVNWSLKTGGLIHYKPCIDDTGLYFGNDAGEFFKIDDGGNILWTYKARNKFGGDCEFYKDLVLTSSWDTNFYGLNKNNGTVSWKVSSGTYNFSGPEIVGNDVYFATHEHIYRIDASSGKKHSIINTPYLVHVIFKDGNLWTNEKGLTKRNLDGQIIAKVEFASDAGFKPLAANGFFILGGDSNHLFGVSKDLKVLWTLKQSESFWSAGVIQDNVYYTGNRNNNVYAIQLPQN